MLLFYITMYQIWVLQFFKQVNIKRTRLISIFMLFIQACMFRFQRRKIRSSVILICLDNLTSPT